MSLQAEALALCVFLTFVSLCPGLQFSIDRTSDGRYYGRLKCVADKTPNIFSIYELTIYNITETNNQETLTSVAAFHPVVTVEPSKVNVIHVTGNASVYHAELTVAFLNEGDVQHGSFLCELDYVNNVGKEEVIHQVVTPGSNQEDTDVENLLASIAAEVKTLSNNTQTEFANLRLQNEILQEKLDTAASEISWIRNFLNSTYNPSQSGCYRGMSQHNPRQRILLWDKVWTLCDTVTDGGGWLVLQSRYYGDIEFYRNWDDYRKGFGTPDTDFWIGNDVIHNLTSQRYNELRIDMEFDGRHYYAHYSSFNVANEGSNYRLTVSGYTGDSGDSLSYHSGSQFSTFDRDNDSNEGSCASGWGGWWYSGGSSPQYLDCYRAHLNGRWGKIDHSGIYWFGISSTIPLSVTEIKVRYS